MTRVSVNMSRFASRQSGKASSRAIGIVGLGLMGNAIASRLAHAGFEPVGFDIVDDRRRAFVRAGYRTVDALAELAGCGIVVLSVFDTGQVETVVAGTGGLLEASRAPHAPPAIVCTSTCDPDRLARLATRCTAAGLAFAEMPISGTSASLARCEAVGLYAGSPSLFRRIRPALTALCPSCHLIGNAVGMASQAKLAINLVLGLNRAALAEGLVLAERFGLDLTKFLPVLKASAAYSRVMDVKGAMMAEHRFVPVQGRVVQSLKDFQLILAQAEARGQVLPFASIYAQLFEDCVARGEGDEDNAFIVSALARLRHDTVEGVHT